jgi:hypothetical protein
LWRLAGRRDALAKMAKVKGLAGGRREPEPIPPLPEYGQLWGAVLARRAELITEIQRWERPDHPSAK